MTRMNSTTLKLLLKRHLRNSNMRQTNTQHRNILNKILLQLLILLTNRQQFQLDLGRIKSSNNIILIQISRLLQLTNILQIRLQPSSIHLNNIKFLRQIRQDETTTLTKLLIRSITPQQILLQLTHQHLTNLTINTHAFIPRNSSSHILTLTNKRIKKQIRKRNKTHLRSQTINRTRIITTTLNQIDPDTLQRNISTLRILIILKDTIIIPQALIQNTQLTNNLK